MEKRGMGDGGWKWEWKWKWVMKLTPELLPALGHLLGMVLLDLGPAGLLGGLDLEPLDVGAGVADLQARGGERAVGVALGDLGRHHALPGLQDRRVDVGVGAVAVAEGAREHAAVAGRVRDCVFYR